MKLVSLLLVFSGCAMAQTSAGSVTGSVTDAQQAMIAGAKVTVVNLATNVAQVATSGSAGIYSLPVLEPGSYRLTAEAAGFKKLLREPVVVEAGRAITLDLQLEVGNAASEITVSAAAPLVEDASSTVQYGIEQKVLDELPLPNQNALGVLLTVPGVTGDPGTDEGAYHTGIINPGTGVSISGGRPGATQFQADGVSNNASFQGRIALTFSSDALQEVSVKVNSYSAEYGRVGGGIVNMVTKSGSNALHGTLFSFIQNDKLNAAPYQNSWSFKNPLRYWRGGIDFGGPVYLPRLYDGRNRTFFFFSYEPKRQYAGVNTFVRAPTALERTGDFSQSLWTGSQTYPTMIFQHFLAGTGTPITEPANTAYPIFANSVIPKQLISPIGQKLINLFPLPNMPVPQATGENYREVRQVRNSDNRYMAKIDQVVTQANRLSFRLAQAPMMATRFVYGNPVLENTPNDQTFSTNVALSFTTTWGGNKVNDFRAGFNRFNYARRENDTQLSKNWFTEYGFPSLLDKGFPAIAINPGGNHFTSAGYAAGSYEIDNSVQVVDSFNWTRGKHSVKAGFQVLAPQQNLINYGSLQGSWAFDGATTNIGSGNTATYPGLMTASATTGYSWAGLLLGYPTSVSMAPAAVPYQYRWKNYAGYVQDDLRITPSLTLNLGFRYQVEVPRSEKNHNQGTFVPDVVTLSTGAQQVGYVQMDGLGGTSNTLFPTRYNNYEPRIGLAWRPPKVLPGLSVIRAGYAISHVGTSTLFSNPIPDLSPPSSSLAASGGAHGGYVQLDNNPLLVPSTRITWPADGKLVNLQNLSSVYYLNPNVAIPYVQQWNFGLGFTFSGNYALEASYVGSKGTNLFGPAGVFNAIDPVQYAEMFNAGVNMAATFPNPAGLKDLNGKVIQVTQSNLLRPNPTVGDISQPLAQGYNTTYHALQVQFKKRYSHGLQLNVSYTWSKSMDSSSCDGQFCNGALGQHWWSGMPQLLGGDRKVEHSVSVFDVPHNLRFSSVWDVPVGKGKTWWGSAPGWLDRVVGGWTLSGLGNVQSGSPITVYNGSNSSGTNAGWPDGVGYIRPNILLGVDPINPSWRQYLNTPMALADPYLNINAFTPAARLTLGTMPRAASWLRMPHQVKFDCAILKSVPIREQVRLVFRAELYGALNHPVFEVAQNTNATYTGLAYQNYVMPPVAASNILSSFSSLTSGQVFGTRTMQLGLKLYF